ncbi:MAG: PAS domain S-box protein, partial [Rhodocyclaceae bacterium]|nr:PAS domain S-box protein [Rhodocyclaceae bacterium]
WIGRTAEEVVGHAVGDYFSGESAERDAELDAQVFAGGGPCMREQLWPGEAGDGLRNIVVQKVAGRGPDGEPLVVGVYHDVTDLRSAFARFQAAIDTTPLVAIVGVDAEGHVTLWNRAAEDIYGHRAAQVLGRPAAEFVVMRTDLATFSELCAGVRESGRPMPVREFQVVVGDGRTVWILGAIFPVTRAGEVAELFAMGVDVTARRKALEDLETSEARFRSLSELSSDWFWEQDAECRFTAMSIGVEKGGLTPAAALGKTRWELPIEAGEAQWAEHRALLAARRPFHDFQYRIRDLSGGWRWYSVSGEPVFDPAGAFAGYRGVGKDITESKRAEDELRRHRDHLEDLVREQTADLLRAKEAAETANRFKSEFLANMTHELRTPMHAILSFARLGKGKAGQVAPDRLAAYFDKVVDGGLRLLALIDDLLDYSRLEAGKMPIERRPANLAEVCRQVIADTLPLAEAKGLDVSLVEEGGAATGSFDPQRMGQVVSNLLSNAIKFSPAGGRITVTVGPDELSAGRRAGDLGTVPALRLEVADEGVGIPEGELESVFDMFVQSSRTRTGAGGTGLGLAICREIVTFHRGIIRARNRETGGALFEAVIPKT